MLVSSILFFLIGMVLPGPCWMHPAPKFCADLVTVDGGAASAGLNLCGGFANGMPRNFCTGTDALGNVVETPMNTPLWAVAIGVATAFTVDGRRAWADASSGQAARTMRFAKKDRILIGKDDVDRSPLDCLR